MVSRSFPFLILPWISSTLQVCFNLSLLWSFHLYILCFFLSLSLFFPSFFMFYSFGDMFIYVFLLNFWWCTVLAALKEKFGEATRRRDVKAIVLTGELWSSLLILLDTFSLKIEKLYYLWMSTSLYVRGSGVCI